MGAPFLKSFAYAAKGIATSFLEGRNFKVQTGFAIVAVVLGIALRISFVEWAAVFACMGIVLGGECMNTAVEALVDLVSPEYNELAGKAKDCAAGAVLVGSIFSVAVAAVVFLPRIVDLALHMAGA